MDKRYVNEDEKVEEKRETVRRSRKRRERMRMKEYMRSRDRQE
jgi:hypothetical protein